MDSAGFTGISLHGHGRLSTMVTVGYPFYRDARRRAIVDDDCTAMVSCSLANTVSAFVLSAVARGLFYHPSVLKNRKCQYFQSTEP